jgi:pyrimidine-specific ribonucleoside hydrolase
MTPEPANAIVQGGSTLAEKNRILLDRRAFLSGAALAATGLQPPQPSAGDRRPARVPVIDITDLYHPPQDPGDNFDLVAAYALPEVDLRAVILDVTDRFRQPVAAPPGDIYQDTTGPRDPGFIPVLQLNYLFGRNVPCAAGPFGAMRSPEDRMLDAPAFQQQGVNLLLRILRESREKVHVLSFGSARVLAVAWNREPKLLRAKIARVHLCAGAAPAGYLEWNVMLDRRAFVRLLRSDLPIALYPCATDKGPFDLGRHNSFWKLPDLRFLREMRPGLQRYLAFAFERVARMDFLRAMESDFPPDVMERVCGRPHNVWETAVWAQVTNRRLVRRADGHYRLVPASEVSPSDTVLPNELRLCRILARDDGQFDFEFTAAPTNFFLYDREDPLANERALQEALPALYTSFKP